MKTKTIFKTLALATMMPAMLLTTACSSDDDAVNNEINNNGKGYALPVTINVTRGDDATTRATYNEGTKTLSFSSGDQLFVKGTEGTAGAFAGTLEWQSGGTFSGTIYTENSYTGTADALLGSASTVTATLLPDGYGSIGYLSVSGDGYSATLATDATKAFATSKADGVAQLSLEQASEYSSGFELAPQNAILNFTAVTGQWGSAPASSSVSLQADETIISGSIAPVEGDYSRALANFAIAVAGSASPSSLTLTVDGTSVSLGSHTLTAGKIYNQKCANINAMSPYIQANEKWLVYGTGEPTGWGLSVAEGATVTLSNVYLSDASIMYRGNNTIILADGTTNIVTEVNIGSAAIYGMMATGKTLTIKGTGTLIATGKDYDPAIGARPDESCGDITIANTVHLTATAGDNNTKAITTNGGGTVTIGGVVYADGADSPFTYPAPATGHPLSASEVGEIVCSDGLAYAAADKDNLPTGVTAVAIVAYVGDAGSVDASSSTYKGLAIAMSNANDGSGCGWGDYFVSYNCVSKSNDIATAIGYKDGISSTNTLTSDDHSGHYHEAATAAVSNNGTAAPTGTSGWFLPSMGQWNLIVQGLASKKAGSAVTTDISTSGNDTYTASNLNSVITDAGGTGFNGDYHSSTQYDSESCWHMNISSGRASDYYFYAGDYVRSVLAF
ncbi:MAG: hypothetical protein J6Z14_11590 [Prevotella sp.]|nr:hypothetical protein [Prevotella sp.]